MLCAYLADKTAPGGVLVQPVRQEDGHFRTHRELAPASVAREPTRQRLAVPQEVKVTLVALQTLRPHTAAQAYQHTLTRRTRAQEAMVSRWVQYLASTGSVAVLPDGGGDQPELLVRRDPLALGQVRAVPLVRQEQPGPPNMVSCVRVVRCLAGCDERLCACGVYVFFL